jgi:hypothetical protein
MAESQTAGLELKYMKLIDFQGSKMRQMITILTFAFVYLAAPASNASSCIAALQRLTVPAVKTTAPKTHILFAKSGEPMADYNHVISQHVAEFEKNNNTKLIRPGDILEFSDGAQFEYIDTLGSGITSAIFKVYDLRLPLEQRKPEALRIPYSISLVELKTEELMPMSEFINYYVSGYDLLAKQGLPVPKLRASVAWQYVLTEIIPHNFSGTTFFLKPEEIDKNVLQKAEDALYRFAKLTSQFVFIADFRADQIVYNISEDKWYLLDWTTGHLLYQEDSEDFRTPFYGKFSHNLEYKAKTNRLSLETKQRMSRILSEIFRTTLKARNQKK